MENQESNLSEDNSAVAVLEKNDSESSNQKKLFPTDQKLISSIIEGAFPKGSTNKQIGLPQSDTFAFASRIFFLWVWPIVLLNKIRNLISNLNFCQPFSGPLDNNYVVKDTETIYTMTKDSFGGKGGMKFMGIRFMSIWVFPVAIMGTVIEFLFVGPLKGTNPFG